MLLSLSFSFSLVWKSNNRTLNLTLNVWDSTSGSVSATNPKPNNKKERKKIPETWQEMKWRGKKRRQRRNHRHTNNLYQQEKTNHAFAVLVLISGSLFSDCFSFFLFSYNLKNKEFYKKKRERKSLCGRGREEEIQPSLPPSSYQNKAVQKKMLKWEREREKHARKV